MSAQTFLPTEHAKLPTDLPLEIPSHADHGRVQQAPSQPPTQSSQGVSSPSVKTILSWHSPGRPFRKKGREYFLSILLIMLLVQVILFLFSQYTLMAVVVSLVFLAFALASVPPADFHYKISNQGITIEDHFFLWEELYDFYFKKRDDMLLLHIRTKDLFPGELTITLGDMNKEHLKDILARFLPYREITTPTFMEKSGDWLTRNFPLEKQKPTQ